MSQQLFIPETIKVGFQNRSDTYTGQLAYVIYYDKKGVLRKEKSWEGWRDKKIDPLEFKNEPTSGFVLNKKVGGYKSSWNFRNAYIRVFDPRNFEFEISVPNLLFILREGDCSRGKGLEGQFVYSWDGTELVLLPVESEDYKNSANFTSLQDQSVKAKEMLPGGTYLSKSQTELVFIGRLYQYRINKKPAKMWVFWNGKHFEFLKELKSIAKLQSDAIVVNYAELLDNYNKSVYGSKIVSLITKPIDRELNYTSYWTIEESPGVYILGQTCYDWHDKTKINYTQFSFKAYMHNGEFVQEHYYKTFYRDASMRAASVFHHYGYGSPYDNVQPNYVEPTDICLWARLESGSEYEISYESLIKNEVEENDDGEE